MKNCLQVLAGFLPAFIALRRICDFFSKSWILKNWCRKYVRSKIRKVTRRDSNCRSSLVNNVSNNQCVKTWILSKYFGFSSKFCLYSWEAKYSFSFAFLTIYRLCVNFIRVLVSDKLNKATSTELKKKKVCSTQKGFETCLDVNQLPRTTQFEILFDITSSTTSFEKYPTNHKIWLCDIVLENSEVNMQGRNSTFLRKCAFIMPS